MSFDKKKYYLNKNIGKGKPSEEADFTDSGDSLEFVSTDTIEHNDEYKFDIYPLAMLKGSKK